MWRNWITSILSSSQKKSASENLEKPPIEPQKVDVKYRLLPIQIWIGKNITPYAWDRICLKLFMEFSKEKISPLRIDAGTLASPSLVLRLNEELLSLYGTYIPSDVLQKAESTQETNPTLQS